MQEHERTITARMGQNQVTFRKANERIEATADAMALVGQVPFICECSDSECTEIVRLDLPQYEEVRQHPRRFFVAPGHQHAAVEAGAAVVVAERPELVVVDKVGIAGEIAETEYPGSG